MTYVTMPLCNSSLHIQYWNNYYGFLFFHVKTCFSFTKSLKLKKQLEKRYDTNKAILGTVLSLAGVVQYAVDHPFEAFKTLILSGMH